MHPLERKASLLGWFCLAVASVNAHLSSGSRSASGPFVVGSALFGVVRRHLAPSPFLCRHHNNNGRKQANRWEAAHKLASSYMSEGEVRVLYMEQAQKMKAAGSLLEAEKLYLQVGEVTATRMGCGWELG